MQCNTSIEDCLDEGDITFPSFSPEVDTQNRFLPRSEFPSVRQLVISKQKSRRRRENNVFVGKMEDVLVKWRPPASSHRGAIEAINGTHPYQVDTAQFQSRRSDPFGSTRRDESVRSIIESFTDWWKRNSKMFFHDEEQEEEEGALAEGSAGHNGQELQLFEEDLFSFHLSPNDMSTRHSEHQVQTPVLFPYETPTRTRQNPVEREVIDIGDGEELSVYRNIYSNPIPVSYLDTLNLNHSMSLRQMQQQQQQQQQQEQQAGPSSTMQCCADSNWVKIFLCHND
ncbi:YDL186W [Saccharomyces arboricola H-6]|uniref:YDL186W n=1 Tax=Saccharomyces arboricola (strain H-6 / AS 2.3317 / CBS 10644) TaxID=1160507 RepID=J8QA36_SACAR|nr:YDL186W [Saccharomyces arboricola H-6]